MDEESSYNAGYDTEKKIRQLVESHAGVISPADLLVHDSDSKAGDDSDSEDDADLKWKQQFNSMLEIFGIVYIGRDDVEPQKQLGRIYMYSPAGILDVYNVDKVDETRETIKDGDEIMDIQGPVPYNSESSSLEFDLFCGAFKGDIYRDFREYPFRGRHDAFVQSIRLDSIDSTGEVIIHMGFYAHATIAEVEVCLNSSAAAANVYGFVAASNSKLDLPEATSMLFYKEQHKGIIVGTDDLIPLSRSRVAVPFETVLYLDISLVVDGQPLATTMKFSAYKTGGPLTMNFKNLSVTVKWDALYYDSNMSDE